MLNFASFYLIILKVKVETSFSKKNDFLLNITYNICDKIRLNEVIVDWNYNDTKETKVLGEKLTGKKIDFETLKSFRTYITRHCLKNIFKIVFTDNPDL